MIRLIEKIKLFCKYAPLIGIKTAWEVAEIICQAHEIPKFIPKEERTL